MDLSNIHIGKIIKEKWIEKSMTITEFAHGIGRERTTVYDIFRRKSIDIELLIKISENLINFDSFFYAHLIFYLRSGFYCSEKWR